MSFITRATHHLPAFARLYCNGPRPAERILRTAEKALKKLGGGGKKLHPSTIVQCPTQRWRLG